MRWSFLVFGVLIGVLCTAAAAEACTATSVMDQAKRMKDTKYYDAAREAVETEIAPTMDWETEEAVEAATGTILFSAGREALSGTTTDESVGTADRARTYIRTAASKHWSQTWVHTEQIRTVADHAVLHGDEWETGYDWRGNPIQGWTSPSGRTPSSAPEPKPVNNDHAG